jgi:hypothetical protein
MTDRAIDEPIYLNGIDGATGNYLIPPMQPGEAAQFAVVSQPDSQTAGVLKSLSQQASQAHLGVSFSRDPVKLTESGWCVVFHQAEDPAVKAALAPLIEHRRRQIADDSIVKPELEYRDDESVPDWLARYRVGVGIVDPTKIPLYVLLVGSPDRIPFEFGHILDVQYCVGRLHFDTADDYRRYSESVVAYETAASPPNSKEIVFFGPRQANDAPTRLSSEYLVKPLGTSAEPANILSGIKRKTGVEFTSRLYPPDQSTKACLSKIFQGDEVRPPAFLFTASHGVGWPTDHPRQFAASGALLCQDFRSPGLGPLKPEHYFAGSDLRPDAKVHGLVCFHFACYSVGCPSHNRFLHQPNQEPPLIAPKPFFAALPKALLSHASGGALGVFGHVERAWPHSITTRGAGPQLLPFENVIGYSLIGCPLGYALKDFNERYASLSTNLGSLLERKSFGLQVPDTELADRWTERNDAEAYVLFGDPGARVRVEELR